MIKFLTNELNAVIYLKPISNKTLINMVLHLQLFFLWVLLVTLLNSFFLLSFIRGYKKQCDAMIRVYAVFNILKYNDLGEMIGWVLIKKIQFDIFVSTVII